MVRAKKKIKESEHRIKPEKVKVDSGAGREIPIENIDAITNFKELANDEVIRYSKKIGSYYVSMIEHVAGKGDLDDGQLGGLPDGLKEKMREFSACINKNRELQHIRFELKDNAEKALISEIAEKKGLEKDLFENPLKKYELEEVSRGIFVIYMDKDLFTAAYGEKAVVATINKKGICYISLPRECKVGIGTDYLFVENVLHEFHHLAWSFFVNDKKITCDEKDEGVNFCYAYIQDEIIAKLASGGGMACYTSLSFMDKRSLEEFRLKYPGKEEKVKEYLSELNGVMCDDLIPYMQEVGASKQDLIYPVMEADDFQELLENLRKFKTALEMKIVERKKNEALED